MFRCLVVRHAEAESVSDSGLDVDRALTDRGSASMGDAAYGLAQIVRRPELIATSPYERAQETGRIIADAFANLPAVEVTESLAAGSRPEDIMAWLGTRQGRLVAMVGHEPDLGRFVSLALAGVSRSFYPMYKGAVCLIEFPAVPRAGNATLEWALEASHLARLAGSDYALRSSGPS